MLGGRGMGGGSRAPGSILRVMGRAAATRAGVAGGGLQTEPGSSSASKTQTSKNSKPTQKSNKSSNPQLLSLASSATSPFASHGVPLSGLIAKQQGVYWADEDEWIAVDEFGDERGHGFLEGSGKWSAPSQDEVEDAVFALQNFHSAAYRESYNFVEADPLKNPYFLQEISSDGSEGDWKEPAFHICNPRTLSPYVPHNIYDAFYLLRNEPSIQKMVKSLSSDEAVWKAVMNNDAVRELKESFYAEKGKNSQDTTEASNDDSDKDSNQASSFLMWAFGNTKMVVIEAIEKVTKFVMELFGAHDHNKSGPNTNNDVFEYKLRTSFLLSIFVLLVVVVSRARA